MEDYVGECRAKSSLKVENIAGLKYVTGKALRKITTTFSTYVGKETPLTHYHHFPS